MNIMNVRFGFGTFRDYVTKYRVKTREKRVSFLNYLRTHRERIVKRQREKMLKRILFWSIFLSSSYFIYNQIYQKKIAVRKMNNKMDNLYSTIMQKQTLKDDVQSIILTPKNIDQLTNIISLAHKYHYKIIVRNGDITKRDKIILAEQFENKCLLINLATLKHSSINSVNNTLYTETGASCKQINQTLIEKGYRPLFPTQFITQTVYDALINNLPMINGELSKQTVSLQLISASGQNFRSSGQTNRYGQIPSLNPLFIGTGGIFALPSAATFRIAKKQSKTLKEQVLNIQINNVNERIDALRKLEQINKQLIEVQLTNTTVNKPQFNNIFLTCRQKLPIFEKQMTYCCQMANLANIRVAKQMQNQTHSHQYNLFFSVNSHIFQQFLIKYDKEVPFSYKNGLLKVYVQDHQNHDKVVSIINQITNNNGTLVWCQNKELLTRIKPSLDSSQVGAELMRKIVQVRQGLDPRNIFYSHNRYEDYFAKGIFRKLTEFFW